MIATSEQIAEFLASYGKKESISNVRIISDDCVVSALESCLSPEIPYRLDVFLRQTDGLSITVIFRSLEIYENSNILRRLAELNFMLLFGCLNIKPDDGKLCYRVDHFWDNYNNELSPEFFEWLLGNFVRNVRCIEQFEMTVTFYTMLDSHIPRNRAREIMRSKFLEWKDKPAKLPGETL